MLWEKIVLAVFLFFFFWFWFLFRPGSALISWSSTQVLVDYWGTFCAGAIPMSIFRFSYQVAVVGFEPPTF